MARALKGAGRTLQVWLMVRRDRQLTAGESCPHHKVIGGGRTEATVQTIEDVWGQRFLCTPNGVANATITNELPLEQWHLRVRRECEPEMNQ